MIAGAKRYLPLLWMLAIPVLNVFYEILNRAGAHVSSLATGLDERTPFLPAFIIPYLIWYPFIMIMLIVLFMKSRTVYYRTLLALSLGLIGCYLTYYFYQTTISRPTITEHGLFYSLVNMIYHSDGPYNCFPSIHVLTSYLMLKGVSSCTNLSRMTRWFVVVMGWSIIVSTVFVKQHVWLDMAGAILLAEMMYYAAGTWLLPRTAVQRRQVE
ncbi:phosphatase PAP2 family protein [Paenibacillus sepulcri]|uniref:Phosphatase PAP2 family protein n=1 Tax=Paenibacillus sepulcri TaxID=359917 RepID=A0ABS7C0D2_9BACL|nr:phosphatase PAP2 family protein [Paenibacillus sepulcri]